MFTDHSFNQTCGWWTPILSQTQLTTDLSDLVETHSHASVITLSETETNKLIKNTQAKTFPFSHKHKKRRKKMRRWSHHKRMYEDHFG